MLLGARQFFERRAAPAWTNPYVTDGLIAMWDAEWNAGGGVHDPNATTWKDLVGTNDLTLVSGAQTITSSSVVFNDTALGGKLADGIDNVVAIEFCGMVTRNASSAIFTPNRLGTGGGTSGFYFFSLWYYNNSFGAGHHKNGFSVGANSPFTVYSDYVTSETDFAPKALNGVVSSPTGASDYYSVYGNDIGFGFRSNYPFGGEVYNLRIYSRSLTVSEIAANAAVDAARFNIATSS